MNFFGSLAKGVSALVVSLLSFGIFRTDAAAPAASFSMYPDGNPVLGQTVQFTDTSTGSPTSWTWDFGDGQGSSQQNPAHVYGGPGTFQVTLTAGNGAGSTHIVQPVVVTAIDTLQLNNKGGHPFIVRLTATNQHNNNVQGAGQAIPQSDLFGYFSFPSLTNNPSNPEVFVKILDGRPINGQYWVFYGHLTDLIYDLSVTEVATGFVKNYHKDAGAQAPGDADTSGFFASTPTPTPTPSSAQTRTVYVGGATDVFVDPQSGNNTSTIHVGDTVNWVWVGNSHSTTSGTCVSGGYYGYDTCTQDGQWDSGLQSGSSNFSHVFTTAGTFPYYCQKHMSMMTGRVIVQP